MTEEQKLKLISAAPQREVELNLRGLRLERQARERLHGAQIYAQTGVSLEHQTLARRWVLRAVESGGATAQIGHFVGFTTPSGTPLSWLTPVDAIVPNGLHAVVIAPELLRFEMFRFERSYRLAISRHAVEPSAGAGKRPRLVSRRILLALEGYLSLDLTDPDHRILAGKTAPQFFARSGEELVVPEAFLPWVRALTSAVTCTGCRHAHFAVPPVVAEMVSSVPAVSPEALNGST